MTCSLIWHRRGTGIAPSGCLTPYYYYPTSSTAVKHLTPVTTIHAEPPMAPYFSKEGREGESGEHDSLTIPLRYGIELRNHYEFEWANTYGDTTTWCYDTARVHVPLDTNNVLISQRNTYWDMVQLDIPKRLHDWQIDSIRVEDIDPSPMCMVPSVYLTAITVEQPAPLRIEDEE